MKKIRINELARELEVKPHVILDLLPSLGVTEKKTHSSSIDEEIAMVVRRRILGESPDGGSASVAAERATLAPEDREAGAVRKGGGVVEVEAEAAAEASKESRGEPVEAEKGGPEAAGAPSEKVGEFQFTKAAPRPIRPPLAGRSTQSTVASPTVPTVVAPSEPKVVPPVNPQVSGPAPSAVILPGAAKPIRPPVTGAQAATPSAGSPSVSAPAASPVPGVPAAPAAPSAPVTPPSALVTPAGGRTSAQGQVAPGVSAPPRPGQILPPPRLSTPVPAVPVRPALKAKPSPAEPSATKPSAPQTVAQQRTVTPGPEPKVPLAGQPVARPVVPPRPDMVAKLQQTAKSVPGQPAPRPGAPVRPGMPAPGQPIYRGSIRPGQPLARGAEQGAAPGRPARPRGMHPTSVRVEPTPVPVETRREHAKRPRKPEIDKETELEGKLRLPVRRSRQVEEPPPIDREITISEGITVKELSEKLGVKANLVIKKLVERKIFATINQTLDVALAEEIARAFGASTNKVSFEEEAVQELDLVEDAKDLTKRAPVVTIMGHVDHGKTSLLDAIRQANVAEHEAGGITQHIGAYTVTHQGNKIVFIDTPGHEAFTRMRARGAKVTDIVVLVVAADDGVMPQTLEAIDHARAAKVPIIVAINKIDKPGAQPERIKQQLTERGLMPEEWGGNTVMVPVSAKAKQNLDLLLEMILLVAEMQELKANPNRPAVGTVLEAKLDRGRGPVATVLVQNGTLSVGDHFICGAVFGKVRAMFDDKGQPVRKAGPSTPVEVLGLESLPEVGDVFQQVTDTAKAKQIVLYREAKAREQAMARTSRVSLDQLHEQLKEGETKDLNIIIKADVGGTSEVLAETLQKLSSDKVRIRVMHAGVGAITESDVLLAAASNAIIVGFNVRPEKNAVALAEQERVDIRLHTVIYELTDEIKKAMAGMLEPVFREVFRGRAEVRETFNISRVGTVAGCVVTEGVINRDSEVRLLRDNVVIYTGKIASLKRFKNDASEVKSGMECGVGLAGFNDVKPGDIIEAFQMERVLPEALV